MTRSRAAAALALYLAVAFLYVGLPVAAHPRRDWVGAGADPQIFVWSLAWWPHAILHWENPILARSVWPPAGLDLAWVSSIPGLALAFAPVTLLAGPVLSYNLASVLLPALAAWTAFLLCRHVTRAFWPSLAGGYLFGFSSYELGHLQGHLHMSSVFLLPLVALVALRHVRGELGRRAFALRLAPLLAAQVLLSTEVLFTLTLALLVSIAAAYALVPAVRPRLRRLPPPLAAAYLAAGVLTSPLLAYAAARFRRDPINQPELFNADLLNLVVPTPLTALNAGWARDAAAAFAGNTAENGAYLGLPLLALLAWFAWERRGSAGARLLLALLGLALLAELGPNLRVRGASYAPLPWKAVAGLPGFDNVLPGRLAAYAALAAAVAAASWAAGRAPRAARAALAAAAVAFTVPAFWDGFWQGTPRRPAFFADGTYRSCLRAGETVLPLPFPSWNEGMLWQAEAGFRYRLAQASLTPVVPRDVPDRETVLALQNDEPPAGGGAAVVRLARAQRAGAILLDAAHAGPWRGLLAAVLPRPLALGGVYLYRLRDTLASCPTRSGRRGGSSTSSTSTSATAASSASRRRSSCSGAGRTRSSCSTASRTRRVT
ncbi:MAG TPA: hypothetical protein VFA66_00030 [Gaiellaceae bacterium]|nr:hypothetical protein [Gaiellaceae bacterium]